MIDIKCFYIVFLNQIFRPQASWRKARAVNDGFALPLHYLCINDVPTVISKTLISTKFIINNLFERKYRYAVYNQSSIL